MSLQWGRDRQVADSTQGARPVTQLIPLQWGRDRQVADSRETRKKVIVGWWWLQWGRDRQVADRPPGQGQPPYPHTCFNGAATVRSRIGMLSLGRRRRGIGCFNGAATVRSRIEEPWTVKATKALLASMGPRPSGRG